MIVRTLSGRQAARATAHTVGGNKYNEVVSFALSLNGPLGRGCIRHRRPDSL